MDDDLTLSAIDNIPDSTQRLIMKNYYSMLSTDMNENLLNTFVDPEYGQMGVNVGSKDDWSSLYSW